MNYYQQITLLPDAEISPYFLWQKIYQKLHLGLVNLQDAQDNVPIGVAFPDYCRELHKTTLGNKLRLFAQTEQPLQQLAIDQLLSDFDDHIHITSTRETPNKNIQGYAAYYRIQPKSSDYRIQRRKEKYQHSENHPMNQQNQTRREQKYQHISRSEFQQYQQHRIQEQQCDAPFIHITSQSNGQPFRLFIGYQIQTNPNNQSFNTYGLSKTNNMSTVPIF